jgi:hypothetical protein
MRGIVRKLMMSYVGGHKGDLDASWGSRSVEVPDVSEC